MHYKSLIFIASGLAAFASAAPADLLTSTLDTVIAPLKTLLNNNNGFSDPNLNQCTQEQLDKIRQWTEYAERYYILVRRAIGAEEDKYALDSLVFEEPPTGENRLSYKGIPCQEFYDMQAYYRRMR
ncbi:hypothetical protein C0993_007246, partial [Termitomyces sp. T159_Od127]